MYILLSLATSIYLRRHLLAAGLINVITVTDSSFYLALSLYLSLSLSRATYHWPQLNVICHGYMIDCSA